jgi:hypothetical protein
MGGLRCSIQAYQWVAVKSLAIAMFTGIFSYKDQGAWALNQQTGRPRAGCVLRGNITGRRTAPDETDDVAQFTYRRRSLAAIGKYELMRCALGT